MAAGTNITQSTRVYCKGVWLRKRQNTECAPNEGTTTLTGLDGGGLYVLVNALDFHAPYY